MQWHKFEWPYGLNVLFHFSDAAERERAGPTWDPVFTWPVLQQAEPAATEWE